MPQAVIGHPDRRLYQRPKLGGPQQQLTQPDKLVADASAHAERLRSQLGAGDWAGQTIAIIDAFDDPNIISDTAAFNTFYSLQQFNVSGGPTLTVVNQSGTSTLPSVDTSADGQGERFEEALDVQWAHVMAPNANIILFEANSLTAPDLYAAVAAARNTSNVTVVSMRFGSNEYLGETQYDSLFTTPSGHTGGGITFVASSGDHGVPSYPAVSPNVVAVGGTDLKLDSSGNYSSESGWSNSGGGPSQLEARPAYQTNDQTGVSRGTPDISMDAAPEANIDDTTRGVAIYDSYDGNGANWYAGIGGTSLSAPMFAGLVAIADQVKGSGFDGATQMLPEIYQIYKSNPYLGPVNELRDVTTGAGADYDYVTGVGTPVAYHFVPDLTGISSPLTFNGLETSSLSYATSGSQVTLTSAISVTDSSNNISGATVGVPNTRPGDSLTYGTLPTGVTASATTSNYELTLTFSGTATAAQYTTLLRSVKFSTTDLTETAPSRRFDFSVIDTAGNRSGVQSRSMNMTNSLPTVKGLGGPANTYVYKADEPWLQIAQDSSGAPRVVADDVDNVYLKGASVVITNLQSGDLLTFAAPAGSGITGSYSSGTLTLSGIATTTDYTTALASVAFRNIFEVPDATIRKFTFYVTDSSGNSSVSLTDQSYDYANISREATVPTVNESSWATYTGFTQNSSAVIVSSDLTIAVGSSDSAGTIQGANVQISNNYVNGRDFLTFENTSLITGTFDYATGTMILTGTATASQYQSALRTIGYINSSDNPNYGTGAIRPITFQIFDGWSYSDVTAGFPTKYVQVTSLTGSTNTLSVTGTTSSYSVGVGTHVQVATAASITDADAVAMGVATIAITGGYQVGDTLEFSGSLAPYVTWTYYNRILTIASTKSLSIANYVTLLKSVYFYNSSNTAPTGTRTLSFQVVDDTTGATASNVVTTSLSVVS